MQGPCNIEAEQAVLGSLLSDTSLMYWPQVSGVLAPDHFSEPIHSRIYDAIAKLCSAGKPATPLTLKTAFEKDETLVEIGGFVYLARLMATAAPLLSLRHHAELLRDLAARRVVIEAATKLIADADTVTIDETFRPTLASHVEAMQALFDNGSTRKTTYTMGEATTAMVERITRIRRGEIDRNAIKTGIAALDRFTGGLHRGEYIILGGRPSMGKTALAVQLAYNIAEGGGGCFYASLEMPVPLLTPRLTSCRLWTPGASVVSYQNLIRGLVSDTEMRWVESARQNPLSDTTKFNYAPNRPRDYVFEGMDQEAISRAVKAQELFGSPVTVTSGMRNPLQNKNAKGVKRSQHMQGKAIDLSIPDKTGAATARLIDAMQEAGFSGIGAYRPGKVHGDIGAARMWGPDTRASSISQLPANIQAAMYSSVPPKQTLVRALSPVVKSGIETIKDVFTPTPRQKPAMPNISPMSYSDSAPLQAQNLVQPTQQQIEKYGGFERAGKLAQMAVGIMNFMPGGSGAPLGTGGGDKRGGTSGNGYTDPRKPNAPPRTQDIPPPVQPPVVPPTVNQVPWFYPQYQSQWAGLPVGIGGYARG